jgi:hypothetical protein
MNPTTRMVSVFAELDKKRPQGSLQADPETASSVVKNREEQIHNRTHKTYVQSGRNGWMLSIALTKDQGWLETTGGWTSTALTALEQKLPRGEAS